METTNKLISEYMVDNLTDIPYEYIKEIQKMNTELLCEKLINSIKNDNCYIIKLESPYITSVSECSYTTSYRQELEISNLVLCGECIFGNQLVGRDLVACRGEYWPLDGYCSRGIRRSDDAKL